MAFTQRITPEVEVKDSDVVFVGYGVVAPEYGWDDFKGVDVKGKTLVFLINDPPLPDPKDPSKLDDKMFKGKAMTYYGRWSYKYEIAAEKGAAAAVIVHETIPAAYPWSVVENSNAKQNFVIDAPDKNMGTVGIRSWITLDTAKKLFAAAGQNYDELKKAALSREFKPVSLGAKADFSLRNQIQHFKSHNVVGRLEGSDPQRKDEYVIYSAHWDHLGRDSHLQGDQIYNGAIDNASGVASILEIAQAFTSLSQAPPRSLLFMATTAEEAGLLGAKYYAENPLYPLDHTLADINIDCVNPWGKTRDIEDISGGNSTLDDLLAQAAARSGRTAGPNSEPEKGSFFRADHFEFAKVGVPALYIGSKPKDYIGQPADYGQKKSDDYTLHHYHQVSDEVNPAWDLSGAVEDDSTALRSRLPSRTGRPISDLASGLGVQSAARQNDDAKEMTGNPRRLLLAFFSKSDVKVTELLSATSVLVRSSSSEGPRWAESQTRRQPRSPGSGLNDFIALGSVVARRKQWMAAFPASPNAWHRPRAGGASPVHADRASASRGSGSN